MAIPQNDKVLAWFTQNIGKLTYSQFGSRNGKDGTADCSGSMSQALNDAYGGATLYSTISMATRLKELGYEKVRSGETTDARPLKYDAIMTTSSSSMAGSAGDSGHIGMMMTNETYISCTAVDWLGRGTFIKNNAIQTCPWMAYKDVTRLQTYCEIWRKTSPAIKTGNTNETTKVEEGEEMRIVKIVGKATLYLVRVTGVTSLTAQEWIGVKRVYGFTDKSIDTVNQAEFDGIKSALKK